MIEGLQVKDIEQIYDEMTDAYTKGDYLEGVTQWGDDALMSPKTFAERFHNVCLGFGYREAEIIPAKMEIEEWCREHLLTLENKFRSSFQMGKVLAMMVEKPNLVGRSLVRFKGRGDVLVVPGQL